MLAELGRMDRSMMLFLGGVAVILALFVPMSVLQDSEPVRARTSRAAANGQCVCVCVCVCV